jgi:hypothetical protein
MITCHRFRHHTERADTACANMSGRANAPKHRIEMKLSTGISKHGFRKWYERELLQCHAHMALSFICLIGVLAAFESATRQSAWTGRLFDAAVLLICLGTGLWALRRYLHLLMHAEAVAHQADCPSCATYARFRLVRAEASGDSASVCCRKCGHQWTISG